jgi:hypothetical protein
VVDACRADEYGTAASLPSGRTLQSKAAVESLDSSEIEFIFVITRDFAVGACNQFKALATVSERELVNHRDHALA